MASVVAVLCSDIHIENCPAWRSAEPDWFVAMGRSLNEMKQLAEDYKVPVICAGDIFTRWFAGPQLINFAIKHLPKMYCVRGNHDLPNHRHEEIKRSAYWTLVEAGVVHDLTSPTTHGDHLCLYPFGWGQEIIPLEDNWCLKEDDSESVHLAVIHKYVWKEGYGHVGAAEEGRVSHLKQVLSGYDASVCGDNHKGFLIGKPGSHMLLNCGSFFRRHSDEIDYKPHIGLLKSDGSISLHYLDISQDIHVEMAEKRKQKTVSTTAAVLDGYGSLSKDSLDFGAAIRRKLEVLKPVDEVSRLVLSSVDSDKKKA